MNHLELQALKSALSNEARTLYCLYLKPAHDLALKQHQQDKSSSQKVLVSIQNKDIISLLNAHRETVHLGRQISALFKELFRAGLIDIEGEYSFERSLNKHQVFLCLAGLQAESEAPSDAANLHVLEDASIHQQHARMSLSWRPKDQVFEGLCHLSGLIQGVFNADELGEFIAYWLGRPEVQYSEYQWTQKFVVHLKHRRIRQPLNPSQSKVGHQWVTPEASIDFDENVKRLVDKYSESE